jgi:predicted RNA-binding protein with PIN domain
MDLIVDGYNLIGSEHGLLGALEPRRNRLIQRLSAYQKIKGFRLTVVFDGWGSGRGDQTMEPKNGMTILFSRSNEKADDVIVRLARQKGAGSVVVTSDREIRRAVERFGAIAISAGDFSQILRALDRGSSSEEFADEDDGEIVKSGNPNRLSKTERRRNDKLEKLRL